MDKEWLTTTKELSPIILALITIISGLISGLIAIYLGPKIKFKYENKQKILEYRINLISNLRQVLDKAENIEDIQFSSYWGFIKDNLNEEEKKIVFNSGQTIIGGMKNSDFYVRKEKISLMLSRIEKEWILN
jgi:hypothetical protein